MIDVLNWFPCVIFASPIFPFNEVMDSSFLGVGLGFEVLFDLLTVLMFEFWQRSWFGVLSGRKSFIVVRNVGSDELYIECRIDSGKVIWKA